MTATEPLCRADRLRELAALYPLLTDAELALLADMPATISEHRSALRGTLPTRSADRADRAEPAAVGTSLSH